MGSGSGSGVVRIDFDYRKEEKKFDGIMREQFPFAVAIALTRTAVQAQKVVQRETQQRFKLHTMFIPRNIRVIPAKKKDIAKFGLAEAFVGTTKVISFMSLHEFGGTKTPKGSALSLPSAGLGTGFKSETGKIRNQFRPKTLLSRMDKGAGTRKGVRNGKGGGKPAAFVAKGMILVRQGPGRYPLRVLYKFESKARIKSRWEFEDTVRTVVENYFAHNMEASMRFAVETAKVKQG